MIVTDFEGEVRERRLVELARRFTTIRQGGYGAFILAHKIDGPSLWIQVNKALAYLYYFPDPDYLKHAGYRATGMTPPRCKREVRFRILSSRTEEFGSRDVAIPPENAVSLTAAILAAKEFFKDSRLPASVSWQEL